MSDSEPRKKDLSVLPRAQLIRGGFEAVSKKMPTEAIYYFGAAIRKARKIHLYDIEAEFYKFVTLYMEGDYSEAVNRCVECLDGLKLFTDTAADQGISLPRDPIAEKLSECLVQSMVMRRDSFFHVCGHFWQVHMGEYFLLKKPNPLLAAVAKAWMSFSMSSKVSYDLLGKELQLYSHHLQEQLDSARDMIDGMEDDEEMVGERSERPVSSLPSQPDDDQAAKAREFGYADFLKQVSDTTIMGLSSQQLDELHEICRSTRNVTNLGVISRVIDMLGPNSKKSYLSVLVENDLMRSTDTKLPDKDAERLHMEVLDFVEKTDSATT